MLTTDHFILPPCSPIQGLSHYGFRMRLSPTRLEVTGSHGMTLYQPLPALWMSAVCQLWAVHQAEPVRVPGLKLLTKAPEDKIRI